MDASICSIMASFSHLSLHNCAHYCGHKGQSCILTIPFLNRPRLCSLTCFFRQGEGIIKLIESVFSLPLLFVVTYGITLMWSVFGKVRKYEICDRGVTLQTPLYVCCSRTDLDILPGPVTDVARWDDCSRLWHGQASAPIEVVHRDRFLLGSASHFFIFPHDNERHAVHDALQRRLAVITGGPLLQNPVQQGEPPAYQRHE